MMMISTNNARKRRRDEMLSPTPKMARREGRRAKVKKTRRQQRRRGRKKTTTTTEKIANGDDDDNNRGDEAEYIKYDSLFDARKIFSQSGCSNRQKSIAVSHYINDSLDRLVYGYKHKTNVPAHVSFGQPIERIAVGCGLEEDDWEELEGVGLKERTRVRKEMEKRFITEEEDLDEVGAEEEDLQNSNKCCAGTRTMRWITEEARSKKTGRRRTIQMSLTRTTTTKMESTGSNFTTTLSTTTLLYLCLRLGKI